MLTPSHEINESQSQVTASAENVLESNLMLQHLQEICVCACICQMKQFPRDFLVKHLPHAHRAGGATTWSFGSIKGEHIPPLLCSHPWPLQVSSLTPLGEFTLR